MLHLGQSTLINWPIGSSADICIAYIILNNLVRENSMAYSVTVRPRTKSSGLVAAGLISPVSGFIDQRKPRAVSVQSVADVAEYIGE